MTIYISFGNLENLFIGVGWKITAIDIDCQLGGKRELEGGVNWCELRKMMDVTMI
jgi:hypothetical protein